MSFVRRLFGLKATKDGGPSTSAPSASQASVDRRRFVVVDTELTGLDQKRDEIVSVGAVRMEGGRILVGETFHRMARPEGAMTGKSVVIHGITPSDVEAMPPVAEVLDAFVEWLGDDIVVGHCVSIDVAFLSRDLARFLKRPFPNRAIDTFSLHGWLSGRHVSHPLLAIPAKDLRLSEMAKACGIEAMVAHDALQDAFVTAQILQRLLPLLATAGIVTTEELLRVGDPARVNGTLAAHHVVM